MADKSRVRSEMLIAVEFTDLDGRDKIPGAEQERGFSPEDRGRKDSAACMGATAKYKGQKTYNDGEQCWNPDESERYRITRS